ncbi:MAG: HPP family protein [Pseudomonadota bacterium]
MKLLPTAEMKAVAFKSGMLLSLLMIASFYSGVTAMAAPFSASCVLLVLLPKSPFSTPRTVLLAHLLCLSAGAIFSLLPLPSIVLVISAAWIALLAMAWLRAVHAPALAHTVILCLGKQAMLSYILSAALIVISFALLALYEERRKCLPA